jgi:hypothetical protein
VESGEAWVQCSLDIELLQSCQSIRAMFCKHRWRSACSAVGAHFFEHSVIEARIAEHSACSAVGAQIAERSLCVAWSSVGWERKSRSTVRATRWERTTWNQGKHESNEVWSLSCCSLQSFDSQRFASTDGGESAARWERICLSTAWWERKSRSTVRAARWERTPWNQGKHGSNVVRILNCCSLQPIDSRNVLRASMAECVQRGGSAFFGAQRGGSANRGARCMQRGGSTNRGGREGRGHEEGAREGRGEKGGA